MRQRVTFAGDQADVLISDFGGAAVTILPVEHAAVVQLLAFSFATAAATVTLRVFYAVAAGAAANNLIEIYNRIIPVGAIAGGRHLTIIGGQGGCENAWRDETSGAGWTLRATVTGLAGGDAWAARINWIYARGIT